MQKGDRTIAQYLGRIQQIIDILESIGDPVSHRDQLETIVDGLPLEYQALASIIQYRDEPCDIVVAETMLLSHEEGWIVLLVLHLKILSLLISLKVLCLLLLTLLLLPWLSPLHLNLHHSLSILMVDVVADHLTLEEEVVMVAKVVFNARLAVQPSNANQWRAPMVPIPSPWFQGASSQQAANQWIAPQFVQWRAPTADVRPDKRPQAYLAGSETCTSQPATSPWYPDSGATHHVTYSAENFLDNISILGSDQVILGNGQGLSITSIGNTSFHSPHKPHITFTLKNLLLVPKIIKNLISVSQFARDNQVYFKFHLDTYLPWEISGYF